MDQARHDKPVMVSNPPQLLKMGTVTRLSCADPVRCTQGIREAQGLRDHLRQRKVSPGSQRSFKRRVAQCLRSHISCLLVIHAGLGRPPVSAALDSQLLRRSEESGRMLKSSGRYGTAGEATERMLDPPAVT